MSAPRINCITLTYFRSGKCERPGCKGSKVERSKSFTAATRQDAELQARKWEDTPLMHKRCEGLR